MSKYRKLTPSLLRKIVLQERNKLKESLEQGEVEIEKVEAEEVDADDYADTLEKDIDYIKALKISERRIIKKLKECRRAQRVIRRRLKKRL